MPREGHSSCTLNDRLYVFAGTCVNTNFDRYIDIECIDMSLPEEIRDWDVMQMPQIRNNRLFSLCAIEAENKIILMGG